MKITWPMVALIGIGIAGYVALFALIPAGDGASRAALLSVITLGSSAVVAYVANRGNKRTQDNVARVERLVNGNTQALIAKLPDAQQAQAQIEHGTGHPDTAPPLREAA